jgi:hypothetical protein
MTGPLLLKKKGVILKAQGDVHGLYKKLEVFRPVAATLQTMWQARQQILPFVQLPWLFHNVRLMHNISYLED